MRQILNLSKWEFYKLLKMKSAIIMAVLIIMIVSGIGIKEYTDQVEYRNNESLQNTYTNLETNWREREENLIEYATEFTKDEYITEIQRETARRRIEIAKYKLETGSNRVLFEDMWYFFTDNTFQRVSIIVVIFTSIMAAMSVSSEYSDKTIKPLLLLPYKRYKILAAKYLAAIYYAILLLMIVIVLGILSGILIFGFKGTKEAMFLYGHAGPYVMSSFRYALLVVVLKLPDILFYISLSMLFGVWTKSIGTATIAAILGSTIVAPIIIFISKYTDILNYTPFINMDFRKFLDFGAYMPALEDGFQNVVVSSVPTAWMAALILSLYIIFIIGATFAIFCKRDVQ